MNFFLTAAVLMLGASFGSFVNVLIDRSIAGKDWIRGRSVCDYCRKRLAWYDMIPILSYLIYRGKSRCCHRRLSLRHPVVELLFGALFVWWLTIGFVFFKLVTTPLSMVQPMFWLGIGVILAVLSIADWLYGVILMNGVWLGVAWVVLYRAVLMGFGAYSGRDFILSWVAGLAAFGFIWFLRLITKGRGMGDGDPYLIFLTSMLVGYPRVILAVLSAFVVGAIAGIGLLLSGVKQRRDTMPFGPFIVIGAFIALVWGEALNRLIFPF